MDKPIILIPTPVQDTTRRSFSMGKSYISSLIDAGAVPIMVPVTLAERELHSLYESSAGVMLAGGPDIDPLAYAETQHEKTDGIDPDRDRVEFLITRWAIADDKPLFGICRGIQTMNVALGGSLVQDIPSQWYSELRHNGHYEHASRETVLHHVQLAKGSRIEQMLQNSDVGVNSFHHQAVKRLADAFVVTSRAPDGIIETIEMQGKRFCVGVQWHPEEMSSVRADQHNLFASFVLAAAACGSHT